MLKQLLIFTRGGLILWTCRELGNALKGSPIDTLILSCVLEERSGAASFDYTASGAAYTLKWTFHNELGLVFVVVYQKILHLLKEAEARTEELKKSKQVGKPVSNSRKQGPVQKAGIGGDKKNNEGGLASDGVDDNALKGRKLENGISNGNHVVSKEPNVVSSADRKENTSSNLGGFERSDLEPALKALKDRLMTKNVAEEIAEKLCESVAASLEGKKLGHFQEYLLQSWRSIDILRDVHAAKEQRKPYVVALLVAYWLQQHQVSVMMAACDTFRSGAVEQLRTHARRLQIPIFEKGYEKDPAVVAKEAIQEAKLNGSDVVLVDTAGRMQDNEPLMRALSKRIYINNPDLALFVGEALVGNDAVDQLSKFNQKLADLSPSPNPRLIDGILFMS
ncbi:hypothetical protein ACLB2K_020427 [Fragaria x ananassa]